MKLFGFQIGSKSEDSNQQARLPTDAVDNSASIKIESATGGFINSNVNAISLDNQTNTENGFIEKYREMIFVPEVDQCIEEIVSEAIIIDENGRSVEVDMSEAADVPDAIKTKISEAFEYVYDCLMFNRKGYDIFKRWYIDGRVNYFINIDNDNPKAGIQSLQYVDPRKIKLIREVQRAYDVESRSLLVTGEREYFIYNERGIGSSTQNKAATLGLQAGQQSQDIIITHDSVAYCPSGLVDPQTGMVISYLHKAMRTSTNLRMMEDATLIYRLSRAPERRIFYIDTGNLPKAKAEQYVQEIANKQRSKIVYDAATGEIKNDKKFMALTEDFWLPRKEGSRGTEITTLEGGQQVGEMGEAEYFKDKLYVALNVPAGRFAEQPSIFSGGTAVTRDELRFSRFIQRLRAAFNTLFDELLRVQLTLTGVMTREEWEEVKSKIVYKYAANNYFADAMQQEKLSQMTANLQGLDQFVGKYLSREYIYKHVLNMSDEEAKEQQKLIKNDSELQDMLAAMQDQGAPEVPSPPGQPMQTESLNESVMQDLIDLKDSEIKLNDALISYMQS